MSELPPMRVLLVDPSLFTAPYDAALNDGLIANGVVPTWAVRPTRQGDRQELPPQHVDDFFYRRTERMTFLPQCIADGCCTLAPRWIRYGAALEHEGA